MFSPRLSLSLVLTALLACISASPINKEQTCPSYTIVDTRGTYEPQGASIGFLGMVKKTLDTVPNGTEYNTVYPAAKDQNSTLGTIDIINQVQSSKTDCYVLLGYSQGAAATVFALNKLDEQFDSVKAVLLIGDPLHHPGLACNVDSKGGNNTLETKGIGSDKGRIPDKWINKTLDICAKGDNICDFTQPNKTITLQHLSYGFDEQVQDMGAQFLEKKLKNASSH